MNFLIPIRKTRTLHVVYYVKLSVPVPWPDIKFKVQSCNALGPLLGRLGLDSAIPILRRYDIYYISYISIGLAAAGLRPRLGPGPQVGLSLPGPRPQTSQTSNSFSTSREAHTIINNANTIPRPKHRLSSTPEWSMTDPRRRREHEKLWGEFLVCDADRLIKVRNTM